MLLRTIHNKNKKKILRTRLQSQELIFLYELKSSFKGKNQCKDIWLIFFNFFDVVVVGSFIDNSNLIHGFLIEQPKVLFLSPFCTLLIRTLICVFQMTKLWLKRRWLEARRKILFSHERKLMFMCQADMNLIVTTHFLSSFFIKNVVCETRWDILSIFLSPWISAKKRAHILALYNFFFFFYFFFWFVYFLLFDKSVSHQLTFIFE